MDGPHCSPFVVYDFTDKFAGPHKTRDPRIRTVRLVTRLIFANARPYSQPLSLPCHVIMERHVLHLLQ